ncbi:MAG: serine/threonine-protein kinase [Gemmatimonadota bacterium]|nr:serine/threonine-protein kinase [Gemmatimonadota bacterium]
MLCTLSLWGILIFGVIGEGGLVHEDALAIVRSALAERYEVEMEIGRGGMAFVWRARDLRHDRDVAIKVLYPELARAVGGERFLREIRILAKLSHPHILPLLDSGAVEIMPGLLVPWYVMPFVAEETLRVKLTREGPLPVPVALRYTRELCSALTHAHAQGYIHRDIKPENILLRGDQAVLADFGIARAVTVASGTALSSTGLVVGTPAYMSPEQSLGSNKLDARSDIYSLGVVLYEMLAGHPPFTGATPQAISARHQFETPPPIGVVRPGLPAGVEAVVTKALAKVPADRYGTAGELEQQLELPARTGTLSQGRRPGWWRGWKGAAVVAGALIMSGTGAIVLPRLLGPSIDPERVIVLPFQHVGDVAPALIRGVDCMTLVYDALGRWPDLPQVDGLRVQSALAASGIPETLEDGERVARSLGAGRIIWGQLYLAGDSLRVRAFLYELGLFGSRTIAEYAIGLPRSIEAGRVDPELSQQVVGGFIRLARHLLASSGVSAATVDESLETNSWGALRAKLSGDAALAAWDVRGARTKYREATALDQGYPQANLSLAQLGAWLGDPEEEWRSEAQLAARGRDRLTPRQRSLATALVALGAGRNPEACATYRAFVGRDSSDFTAWLGLGDCLSRDRNVVPAKRSPSGWAFRSSYAEALRAYSRAFELVPLISQAFTGPAMSTLLDRFFIGPNHFRLGVAVGPDSSLFGAFPQELGDTQAFVPRPIADFLAGRWRDEQSAVALALGQRALLETTSDWVKSLPRNQSAWRAHAIALELAGRLADGEEPSASALPALRKARGLGGGQHEALDLAVSEVRVLAKLARFGEVHALADSLLGQTLPATPDEHLWLACLAALLGRVNRSAELIRGYAPAAVFVTSEGVPITGIPLALREEGLRLLAYAASGTPIDSMRLIYRRLGELVRLRTPAQEQAPVLDALTARARLFGFPAIDPPDGAGLLPDLERAIQAGDTDGIRIARGALEASRSRQRAVDRGTDGAALEARLLLSLGDSTGAGIVAREVSEGLPVSRLELLADIPNAAGLGLSWSIRSRLDRDEGAARARSDLDALWARADSSLKRLRRGTN